MLVLRSAGVAEGPLLSGLCRPSEQDVYRNFELPQIPSARATRDLIGKGHLEGGAQDLSRFSLTSATSVSVAPSVLRGVHS